MPVSERVRLAWAVVIAAAGCYGPAPGPLDLLIRFWAHGAIDNVRLDCVR